MAVSSIDTYLKAGNPETPQEQLAVLANSEDRKVRLRVAENPSTPPEVLARLAGDGDAEIRQAVATNQSSPLWVVFRLAQDNDPTVRHGLAEDLNAPLPVLKLLATDENPYVSCRARRTIEALGLAKTERPDLHQLLAWPVFRLEGGVQPLQSTA
ncbi:MAG TPA: hypothetical protein V6D08_09440 [Candidatus Obscuribacterales bacterium]